MEQLKESDFNKGWSAGINFAFCTVKNSLNQKSQNLEFVALLGGILDKLERVEGNPVLSEPIDS